MFIYKITNIINNKVYIGLTMQSNPKNRFSRHISDAKKGVDTYFYNSIRKYGQDNFIFEVIFQAFDLKALNEFEIYFIQYYKSNDKAFGYNILSGGNHAPMSEESKQKLSKTLKQQFQNGRVAKTIYPDGYVPWNKGKQYKTGRSPSEKQRAAILKANLGVPKSVQHKLNLSKAKLIYHKTNEHCMSKKVLCIETNQIFDSAVKASKHFGFPVTAAARVANGGRPQYKGFTFCYVQDEVQ